MTWVFPEIATRVVHNGKLQDTEINLEVSLLGVDLGRLYVTEVLAADFVAGGVHVSGGRVAP